eukprot:1448547-Rhodomonas_salina.4
MPTYVGTGHHSAFTQDERGDAISVVPAVSAKIQGSRGTWVVSKNAWRGTCRQEEASFGREVEALTPFRARAECA